MKKIIGITLILLIMLAGCGSAAPEFSVETAPKYKSGESFPFTLEVTDKGEPLLGLAINGTLEMEKMDHGTIAVEFTDNGDGTYTANVELPMGGEWLAAITGELDGKTYDDLLTFNVE